MKPIAIAVFRILVFISCTTWLACNVEGAKKHSPVVEAAFSCESAHGGAELFLLLGEDKIKMGSLENCRVFSDSGAFPWQGRGQVIAVAGDTTGGLSALFYGVLLADSVLVYELKDHSAGGAAGFPEPVYRRRLDR